jgi:hypothetical protein
MAPNGITDEVDLIDRFAKVCPALRSSCHRLHEEEALWLFT